MSEQTATEIRIQSELERATEARRLIERFDVWWDQEGSAMRPEPDEDAEEHVHRVCKIAWLNGAFRAT